MIGPDRYYATFGQNSKGKESWRVADDHCSSRDAGGEIGNAQLAIPYSSDDAHYMKHLEYARDTQAWVGKLFRSKEGLSTFPLYIHAQITLLDCMSRVSN